MSHIKIIRKGKNYELEAKDHATGSEKVCAAVSFMVQSIYGYLLNSSDVYVSLNEIKPAEAYAHFKWYGDSAARAVFELALIGFLSLELSGKQYIKVEYINHD